jgi:chromate transport protein ChrA
VLPSLCILMGLSTVILRHDRLPLVAGISCGLKPAVLGLLLNQPVTKLQVRWSVHTPLTALLCAAHPLFLACAAAWQGSAVA